MSSQPTRSTDHGRLRPLLSSTWLLGLLLCAIGALVFIRVTTWSERNEFARLDDLATRQLDLYVVALESELLRHADLPSLLSADPDIGRLVAQIERPTRAVQAQASRRLARFAAHTGTREIFVVDRDNSIRARSNGSVAGASPEAKLSGFSCASARAGKARGFLFNPQTAAPEYFFVHAIGASIAEPATPSACIVVKISLAPMESTWVDFSFRPESEKILVFDANDVAILSSVPYWRYKTTPLFHQGKPVARRAAESAATYPVPITPLEIADIQTIGRGALLVSLPTHAGSPPTPTIAHHRPLVSTGWQVVLLSNPEEFRDNIRAVQFASLTALAFLGLLALYLHHRRKALGQLLQARNALQLAHDDLEITVAHRTSELRAANLELTREIEARQHTEEALLQANKLAMLGQMSAKISHEISQPLTALRALATNSRAFLAQQKWPRVDENLATIAEITARMSNITRQLKTFSGKTKKPAAPYHSVILNQSLANARALLHERFENEQVTLTLPERHCLVLGDSTQLDQVFVNLFSNALDAMRLCTHKEITVTFVDSLVDSLVDSFEDSLEDSPEPQRILVRVSDSGPGIPADMQSHLFEPFYTSKPTGEGLGLGLVICASIVREHGGTLRAESSDAGAHFIFDLARADHRPEGSSTDV